MKNRIWSIALILPIASVLVCLVYQQTVQSPHVLQWNPWALSEWLINYDAGFVRRGLAGELIDAYASGQPALPLINKLVFLNYLLLTILFVLLLIFSTRTGVLLALMVWFVPGGLLSMAIQNEFYYRKEIIFHGYLGAMCVLYLVISRLGAEPIRRASFVCLIFVILGLGLLLPLIHEAFLFTSVTASVLLLSAVSKRIGISNRRTVLMIYSGVSVAIFVMLSIYKGDVVVARAIWDGLNAFDRNAISPSGEILGGIQAIGWSTTEALKRPGAVLLSGMVWYWVFAISLSWLYCMSLASSDTGATSRTRSRSLSDISYYLFILLGTSPLFIFGWDYGRWIASVNITYLIVRLTLDYDIRVPVKSTVGKTLLLVSRGFHQFFSSKYRRRVCILMVFVAVTFRLPECCLSVPGRSNLKVIQKWSQEIGQPGK